MGGFQKVRPTVLAMLVTPAGMLNGRGHNSVECFCRLHDNEENIPLCPSQRIIMRIVSHNYASYVA